LSKLVDNSKKKKGTPVFDEANQTNNGFTTKLKGSLQVFFNIQARDTLDGQLRGCFTFLDYHSICQEVLTIEVYFFMM